MTFRQFAVLIIRLQAVWLVFDAIVDLSYLPTYIARFNNSSPTSFSYGDVRRTLFLAILRTILHFAAAVALIQYADRVLSWLVRDWIQKPPPDKTT